MKWYLEKKNMEEEENIRIVEAAADIIRRDIRSLVFDTKIYPAMESLDSGQLPETFKTFLNRVIQGEVVERNNTVIGEAIMSACRPRSYISPTLLGIGVYIHWHHASRQLVDILSSLSFSASYKEVQRCEFSALEHDRVNTSGIKKLYIQYAFDNTDFNIRTLTGHGTFHSMSGVQFITPAQNQESMTVNRLLHPPSADTIAARGKLQVNCYKKSALPGLKGINIRELATVCDATARSVKNAIAADVLLSSARWLGESSAPSWNVEERKCRNQGSCIVTFDQPLFAKASEIIAATPPGELDNIIFRLGGLHLLVSFMGSIGFIMSGSGIEELNGKLVWGVSRRTTQIFLDVSTSEKIIPDAVESHVLGSFLASFERMCTALTEQSRTGKLWAQCLRQCMRSMLPYLHAAGHIHYAKSSHLYVQQMEEVPFQMPPHEYYKFPSEGFFIVRKKNEFWGGVWTDLGRGITESTLEYFVAAFPACLKLCNALEEISGIKAVSSEQHVELRIPAEPEMFAILLSYCTGLKNTHLGMLTAWDHLHLVLSEMILLTVIKQNMTFAEIMFDMNTSANTTQADFLSNHHNKERLITLFSHHFETAGIEECKSEGDADTLILKRALELASVRNNVTVVASDTDIAVMLLTRTTDDMELRVLSPESMKEEVCAAGEKFVIALYGRINVNSLDELRVVQYTRSIAKQPVTAAFELATLPLTSAACAEHSLRTYYQQWCDNISLNPVDWSWKLARGFLVPIPTSRAPTPESLLRLVSCGCKIDCGYKCE
ncbi:hypothetical protein PR048_012121 [Dryococelus australis]|uniref:Uncharacterized protein n=1 Tax=Dryococelus australis TaxID=614101 RepID=A0ABQ9HNG8_9NEOP|nr:hypothetical protein PR048_012121 [Dryococelus australis]